MSWNPSSRRALAVVLVVGLLATVGVVGAVSVASVDAPDEAEVNSTVTVEVTLEDLFANESEWELEGMTHLRDATWTVEHYRGGSLESSEEYSGTSFIHGPLDRRDTSADTIHVEVTGEVPVPDEYVYGENETFIAADLVQVYDDGVEWNVIGTWRTHHYTEASRDAEAALASANATIEAEREAGSDVSEAESTFSDAVTAYEMGSHDQAITLAEQAEGQAEEGDADGGEDEGEQDDGTQDADGDGGGASSADADAGESDDGGEDGSDGPGDDGDDESDGTGDDDSDEGGGGLLSIVIGVVVLGLLAGGGYWYAQQQKGPSRDPLG